MYYDPVRPGPLGGLTAPEEPLGIHNNGCARAHAVCVSMCCAVLCVCACVHACVRPCVSLSLSISLSVCVMYCAVCARACVCLQVVSQGEEAGHCRWEDADRGRKIYTWEGICRWLWWGGFKVKLPSEEVGWYDGLQRWNGLGERWRLSCSSNVCRNLLTTSHVPRRGVAATTDAGLRGATHLSEAACDCNVIAM